MNSTWLPWIAVMMGYGLARWAEYRVHAANYGRLWLAGGDERAAWLMRGYYFSMAVFLPMAAMEYGLLQPRISQGLYLTSLTLIFLGFALRFWAIKSLGPLWTMRCVALPGMPILRKGPYKLLRHPEYISRLCDGLGLCLLFSAFWTAGLFAAVSLILTVAIVRAESRQLADLAISRDDWALDS